MKERLQKIISAAGLASRRAAERLLEEGRVTVNGRVASLGESADRDRDTICVNGRKLTVQEKRVYIMLYKPRGYVTTLHDEKGRRTVAELVADAGERLYPVGRLDLNSEGLLLMTNDGAVAQKLMHPSHSIAKVYETTVSGEALEESLAVLRAPMEIDGYPIRPAQVELLRRGEEKSLLRITITEGRNRQVRKMCDQAGLRVHRLRRVQEGALQLGDLRSGKWRYLTDQEIAALQR